MAGGQPVYAFHPQAMEKGTVGLLENNTAAFFETCSGDDYTNHNIGPGSQAITLTMTNQPPAPTFDPIVVEQAAAVAADRQLVVRWDVPATSSPPFAYTIEVFDNPGCTGTPVATFTDRDPEAREKLLSIPSLPSPGVRLTITDIFNNAGKPVIVPVTDARARAGDVCCRHGRGPELSLLSIRDRHHQLRHGSNWAKMPDFTTLQPLAQGAVDYPDLTPRQRRSGYAFDYTGYLKVPATGLYDFTLRSCSGAILTIDGKEIVNADGRHSPRDTQGWAALQAGTHAIELRYFFDAAIPIAGGFADTLSLSYEGPGLARMRVPAIAWSRVPAATEPHIALVSPASGAAMSAGPVGLEAKANAAGAAIKSVQVYLGDYYMGESTSAPWSLNAFLGAADGQPLRARLVYNTGMTLDSPVSLINAALPPLAPLAVDAGW